MPVGGPRIIRPEKELDLEEFHDYHEIVRAEKWYAYFLKQPTVTRKRFSVEKKLSIREHFRKWGNSRETAREFQLNECTVRGILNEPPHKENKNGTIPKGKKYKGNKHGCGKPLSYPKSVDEELLAWIFTANNLHLPCSTKTLKVKAKLLIKSQNPRFIASRGWMATIFSRHR